MQIMAVAEAESYRFNPFDLTKVWPHGDYPPIPLGKLVLNRNPENYFAEVEQAAFDPANMVPGIEPSPDKMLLGRLFSYPDTHRYRIGVNYQQLPISRPRAGVRSYNRDGAMRYDNPGDPVYVPNSYGGPVADPQRHGEAFRPQVSGQLVRSPYTPHRDDDDFVQPRALYQKVLSETDRNHLVANIVSHVKQGVTNQVKSRVIEYWQQVDRDLGARVAKGLG
jgi:catalase